MPQGRTESEMQKKGTWRRQDKKRNGFRKGQRMMGTAEDGQRGWKHRQREGCTERD